MHPQSLYLFTWEFHQIRIFQDCVLSLALSKLYTNWTWQVIPCVLNILQKVSKVPWIAN